MGWCAACECTSHTAPLAAAAIPQIGVWVVALPLGGLRAATGIKKKNEQVQP